MTIIGIVVIFVLLILAQHLLNWAWRKAEGDAGGELLCGFGLFISWVLFGVMIFQCIKIF